MQDLLIGVYLINNFLDKTEQSLLYLMLIMVLHYFIMWIFGSLRSQRHSTPGQHTIQITFVYVVNISYMNMKALVKYEEKMLRIQRMSNNFVIS